MVLYYHYVDNTILTFIITMFLQNVGAKLVKNGTKKNTTIKTGWILSIKIINKKQGMILVFLVRLFRWLVDRKQLIKVMQQFYFY